MPKEVAWMEWSEMQSQVDLNHPMRTAEHFRDWRLAGIKAAQTDAAA